MLHAHLENKTVVAMFILFLWLHTVEIRLCGLICFVVTKLRTMDTSGWRGGPNRLRARQLSQASLSRATRPTLPTPRATAKPSPRATVKPTPPTPRSAISGQPLRTPRGAAPARARTLSCASSARQAVAAAPTGTVVRVPAPTPDAAREPVAREANPQRGVTEAETLSSQSIAYADFDTLRTFIDGDTQLAHTLARGERQHSRDVHKKTWSRWRRSSLTSASAGKDLHDVIHRAVLFVPPRKDRDDLAFDATAQELAARSIRSGLQTRPTLQSARARDGVASTCAGAAEVFDSRHRSLSARAEMMVSQLAVREGTVVNGGVVADGCIQELRRNRFVPGVQRTLGSSAGHYAPGGVWVQRAARGLGDTEENRMRSFELDWSRIVAADAGGITGVFLPRARPLLNDVRRKLWESYDVLLKTYRHYCMLGAAADWVGGPSPLEDIFAMSAANFRRLVEHCRLTAPSPRIALDEFASATSVDATLIFNRVTNRRGVHEGGLERHEFIECILRLAAERASLANSASVRADLPLELGELLCSLNFKLPRATLQDSEIFRRTCCYEPAVEAELASHERMLRKLFRRFAPTIVDPSGVFLVEAEETRKAFTPAAKRVEEQKSITAPQEEADEADKTGTKATRPAVPPAEQLRYMMKLHGARVIETFKSWDEDGSGVISQKEFRQAVVAMGFVAPRKDIDKLFSTFDKDRSGSLGVKELEAALADRKRGLLRGFDIDEDANKSVPEQLRDALAANAVRVIDLFREWDDDRSGSVTAREFRKAMRSLGFQASRAEVDAVFSQFDQDGSGSIDQKELEAALKKRGGKVRKNRDQNLYNLRNRLHKKAFDGALHMRMWESGVDIDEESDVPVHEQIRDALARNCGRVTELFAEWDEDGSGTITSGEFRKAMLALNFYATPEQYKALFDEWDPDHSGKLELVEVKRLLEMRSTALSRPRGAKLLASKVRIVLVCLVLLRKEKVDQRRLSLKHWLLFCRDVRLLNKTITPQVAACIFSWSRLRVVDESDPLARIRNTHLDFEDFLEAIARLSAICRLPTEADAREAGAPNAHLYLASLRADPAAMEAFVQRHESRPRPQMHDAVGALLRFLSAMPHRPQNVEEPEPRQVKEGVDDVGVEGQAVQLILDKLHKNVRRVVDMLHEWDTDGGGTVSLKELGRALRALELPVSKADTKKVFAILDVDGSGAITYDELKRVLKAKSREMKK